MLEENIPQTANTQEEPKKKASSFLNIFNFKGRINRLQFFILFIIIAPFAAFFAIKNYFIFILIMLFTIPSTIKRFHDMNFPAWTALISLGFIILWPFSFAIFALTVGFFINAILLFLLPVLLVILYCLMLILVSGTEGENQYGPQPVFLVKKGRTISKKFFFITALIITVLITGIGYITKHSFIKSNKLQKKALQKYKNKEYPEAIEYSNKLIELDPNNIVAYDILGTINYKQKDYKQAVENYDKAISLIGLKGNPKDPDAISLIYETRASAHQELGNYQQSLKDCQEAIKLNPKVKYANAVCAINSQILGNYQDAINYYLSQIEITPENSGFLYSQIGEIYFSNLKNSQEAITNYNKAIELNYMPAYYSRSLVRYEMKDYQWALEDLSKISNYIKTHQEEFKDSTMLLDALKKRGDIYFKTGNYINAIEDYSSVIDRKPNDMKLYYNRAITYVKLNNNEQALKDLQKAYTLTENLAEKQKINNIMQKITQKK